MGGRAKEELLAKRGGLPQDSLVSSKHSMAFLSPSSNVNPISPKHTVRSVTAISHILTPTFVLIIISIAVIAYHVHVSLGENRVCFSL